MKEELKIDKLEDTYEKIEVETHGCLDDCRRRKWVGNSNFWTKDCKKEIYTDAHWITKH